MLHHASSFPPLPSDIMVTPVVRVNGGDTEEGGTEAEREGKREEGEGERTTLDREARPLVGTSRGEGTTLQRTSRLTA